MLVVEIEVCTLQATVNVDLLSIRQVTLETIADLHSSMQAAWLWSASASYVDAWMRGLAMTRPAMQ